MKRNHGMSKTKTYRVWAGVIQRCTNPKVKSFCNYGGRGISVCERWMNFQNFFADMGECPENYSIERIDVNGPYEKGNCIWIPFSEQAKNKRSVQKHAFFGAQMIRPEIVQATGLKYATVSYRLKHQVSLEKPLGLDKFIEFRGVRLNQKDWAKKLGIAKSTITARLQKGWPIDRVLNELP